MSVSASVAACSNASVGYAIQHAHAGISSLNFTVATSGNYKIAASWTGSFALVYNLSSGASTTGGTFYAMYALDPVNCLFDRTAQTGGCENLNPISHGFFTTGNGSAPTGATLHVSFSRVVHFVENGLVAGHRYYLREYLGAFVQAGDLGGLTTGSATSVFEMSATGGSAQLVAVQAYQ